MTYQIIYRHQGKDIETVLFEGDGEAAIQAAGAGLIARKIQSARVRDLDGSTAEICALRPDGKGGYLRDDEKAPG